MATFGNQTTGTGNIALYNRTYVRGIAFYGTPASAGSITKVSFYAKYIPATAEISAGIYADTGSMYPGTLLGMADVRYGIAYDATVRLYELTFTAPVNVSAGQQVHLGFWLYDSTRADGAVVGYIFGITTAGNVWYKSGVSYVSGTLPSPYPSGASPQTTVCSTMWADYTESGGTTISVTDTGSGVDALDQLLVSCGVSDTGFGAESFSPLAYAPVSDSGQGIDAISVLQELLKLITDSGSGTDSLLSSTQLQVIDQGVGSEILVLSVVLQLLESAVGADNVTVSALLKILESGQGLDLVSLSTLLQIVDSGAGTDSVSVLTAVLKTITDSGTGLDSVQNILASCTLADSGTGSDQPAFFIDLSISDTGSGADAVSTLQQTMIQVLDSAVGSDQILPIVARIPISDQGQGVDAIQALRVALSIIEYAQGLDVIHVDMGLSISQIVLRFSSKQPGMSFSSKQPRISITEGDGE